MSVNLLKMDTHKLEEAIQNRNPLCFLVTILKGCSGFQLVLPEVRFLNEISLTEVIPFMLCQPRTIIENMMKTHAECNIAILQNPDYLTKLVYKYNSGEKEEEYVFSNNMSFFFDVMTICFLYIVGLTKIDHVDPAIKDLIAIMRNKYHISDANYFAPLIITESKIVISYPSISTFLQYYNNNIANHIIYQILCMSNLNIFLLPCCSWLALIIPIIESEFKTPLALLLAMAVVFDTDKPSYILYQRILALYTSEVFPRSLKLEICICLGIIYKEEDKYRFASYFTTHREEAIKLISAKINDTSIEYTLSKI